MCDAKIKPGYICNPVSKRLVKIGSDTYHKLVQTGVIKSQDMPASATESIKTTAGVKGTRKAPQESATLFAVGTEKRGSDGLYIIKLRANGSQYWAKCEHKNSNCHSPPTQEGGYCPAVWAVLPTLSELAIPAGLTATAHYAHKYLKPTASEQRGGDWCLCCGQNRYCQEGCTCDCEKPQICEQNGGNPLLATASELALPLGLVASAHWLRKFLGEQDSGSFSGSSQQMGGNFMPLIAKAVTDLSVPLGLYVGAKYFTPSEGRQLLQVGGNLPIIADPIMSAHMATQSLNLLCPMTLVPLGILLAIYYAYNQHQRPHPVSQTGGHKGMARALSDLVDKQDLTKYQKGRGIKEITPQTEFPFATIMGKSVFKKYVNHM